MACSKEALRIILWMSWATQWMLSCMFVALTLASFTRLWEASSIYLLSSHTNVFTDKSWRAPMSTCLLSALLVLGFDVMSCITLMKKSINRAGPGFGYGFIVAFCFCLSFFLLLAGLVLDSFRPKVFALSNFDWTNNGTDTDAFQWTKYDSQLFIGAEVFAFINFINLLIFAILLVILQTGVTDQLGMNKAQYSILNSTPVGVPVGLQAGYVDPQYGYEAQNGYEDHQGMHGDTQALTGQYQQQGSSTDPGTSAYYQDYGAAAAAPTTMGGPAYFGHAAYGQTTDYTYQTNEEYVPAHVNNLGGSGLLGGQAIGTNPVTSASAAPAPYHN